MWYFLGFLYHTAPADEKLTPDDAQFVDVIHSGGLWIGTDEPVSKQAIKTQQWQSKYFSHTLILDPML